MGVFTAGSCFAQHIGRNLKRAGFGVLDAEPVPKFIDDGLANSFGYRLYSARYGNIYTVRQLRQLLCETFEGNAISDLVWTKGDRFFDSQRPAIEPNGFASEDQLRAERDRHLRRVREAIQATDIFVFTMGLTEAWINLETNEVFPTAPGTIAGEFDPELYQFRNYTYPEILADFEWIRDLLRSINPGMKYLLTVSPVPLTATATKHHVRVATNYSKSVLRAVCGALEASHEDVDYFPSFEIVNHPKMYDAFFEANRRNVSAAGVDAAMYTFLSAHGVIAAQAPNDLSLDNPTEEQDNSDELMCEEALLEAFSAQR